jgi:hypothetical protein
MRIIHVAIVSKFRRSRSSWQSSCTTKRIDVKSTALRCQWVRMMSYVVAFKENISDSLLFPLVV